MVNDAVYSFIEVIDAGSFAKAAEKLYLSSTALMKQMNVLETQLGVQLLIRTNHGITATDAGLAFYYDAKHMIQYAEQTIIHVRQAANKNPYIIRIGTSMLNPCNVLLELWSTISDIYPQFKMKIVPLDAAAVSWPGMYQMPDKIFDVIVGAYEKANGSDALQALKLGEYRFCVAVSREHPLAKRTRLSVADLSEDRLVLLQPGISPFIDKIRERLVTEHPDIHIKDIPSQYTIEVFNRCEERGAVLLTLEGWKDVHPALVTIPVDWEYTIPYGVLYPRKPSNGVQLFVRALQDLIQ